MVTALLEYINLHLSEVQPEGKGRRSQDPCPLTMNRGYAGGHSQPNMTSF